MNRNTIFLFKEPPPSLSRACAGITGSQPSPVLSPGKQNHSSLGGWRGGRGSSQVSSLRVLSRRGQLTSQRGFMAASHECAYI